MNAAIKERIEMINRGEVPEGYKKTRVGIIPEDWEVKRLGELGEFFRGKGIPKAKIITEGIGCITYGEIYTTYNYTFKNFMSYTDEKTAQNSVSIKKNDILFAGSGETLEEIGKCVAYLGEDEAYAGGDIVVFRPYNIDGEVLGYLLNHNIVNSQKYKLGQGHSVVHIYAKDLETILIPVLKEKEQQKIAQILSTWDQAIELKEKLIEEKKEQKKGLMQKLLTGEVRLPGFDGEWEEVRIKDIGVLKSGSGFPNEYQGKSNGKYPFFKVSDMNIKENIKFMVMANNYIDESVKSEINANVIPKDSIIFAKVGAALFLERKRILKTDSCIDNNMMALIVDCVNSNYLFVYYSLSNTRFSKSCNMGALPSLNARDIYGIKLFIPISLQEQKAIAQVLSTADKEIELLEEELELLKLQKKGLMQLLLTGIIRVKC